VSVPILLFAIATFFGGAYGQTVSLILIVLALFYWPLLKKKKGVSIISRITFIGIIVLLLFTVFKGEPKQSIYLSESLKEELYKVYDSKMAFWPDNTEHIFVETKYGKVHVLALGNKENPPLLMFHAASMGAHSWAENLLPLVERYRIYAIDNMGEGNLSELKEALVFPRTPKEIADLYADIANQLGVERSPVFGASNGGFIAQEYAYHYPEKVEALALFGPMGLTPLSVKSIFMLAAASMYPLDIVRDKVVHWAFGDDDYCHEKYGDWFDIIMKATIPSIAQPVPMTVEQKKRMDIPVILFLGTSDPIVGDAEIARSEAEYYPDIEIHILNSGHIIAVEHREFVNQKIIEFLNL
jgi:pimeloyl-ACP methyl ester carboxylesterase